MILLFSIIAGVALFLAMFILFVRQSSERYQAKSRVQGLRTATMVQRTAGEQNTQQRPLRSSLLRIWNWLMLVIGNRIKTMTPQALYRALDARIMHAGKQNVWNPGTFFFIMVLSGVGLVVFMSLFVLTGKLPVIQRIIMLILIFSGGCFLPWFGLSMMISRRQQGIMSQLSDVMDLVCVSVQAGLSFDAALARVAQRMQGPMIEEASRMLQDVRMGVTRRQALTSMAARCDLQPVYLFVAAVIQSESLGVSLANTLKIQADNMRERHRQLVHEKAMKLPIKLLFPLALFIFPTIFIVIFTPIILTFIEMGGFGAFGK